MNFSKYKLQISIDCGFEIRFYNVIPDMDIHPMPMATNRMEIASMPWELENVDYRTLAELQTDDGDSDSDDELDVNELRQLDEAEMLLGE